MNTYYSIISSTGFIEQSQITTDPDFTVDTTSGKRLLKDTPPNFNSFSEQIKRVEPVPAEAVEVPYEVTNLDAEVILEKCSGLVQRALDDFAKTRKYDNIISAASYASSKNIQRALEGQYCVDIRDQCWNEAINVVAKIKDGTYPIPKTEAEVLAYMPVMAWPN